MTDHLLTDGMINEIKRKVFSQTPEELIHGYHVSGIVPSVWYSDCMRAAADWQLEQVIKWIQVELITGDMVADELKKAMRPQQQEEN